MSILNVRDFGAVGDGVHDDFPAFQHALDAIDVAAGNDTRRGAILFVPSGKYRMSQTLKITRSIVLEGAGRQSSILEFVSPTNALLAGIIVEKGMQPSGLETFPDWAIIRNLRVQTPKTFIPPEHLPSTSVDDDDTLLNGTVSGIVLYYRASVENCFVAGFEHDGIHINTSAGLGRNANNWQVRDCFVQFNGRHGLFVSGGDANAGCAINLSCQTNCRWGIFDGSFLGNTYIGCMAESNGHINKGPQDPHPTFGGAYRTTSGAARHALLGCYSEADQISRFIAPTMILGGDQGALTEVDPAPSNPVVITHGAAEVDTLRMTGPITTGVTPRLPISSLEPQPIDPRDSVILVNTRTAISGGFGFLPVPLTLPALRDPSMKGRRYTIKRIDNETFQAAPDRPVPITILVAPGGPETIDGATSLDIVESFGWVTLLAGVKQTQLGDEPNWYVIGRGVGPIKTLSLTLNQLSLTNVDDAAGRWQFEGGEVFQENRHIANYASTKRVVIKGTEAQNTAMLTLTLFFIGQPGQPAENMTLQGSHDFDSGGEIGSVSAASTAFASYIGKQFKRLGNALVIQ